MFERIIERLLVLCVLARAQKLGLEVDNADGAFKISMDGNPWLSGGEVQVSGLSLAKGELKIASNHATKGIDSNGPYEATTFGWAATTDAAAKVLMETSFRTYPADPFAIVFEQQFPSALGEDGPGAHMRGDNKDKCRIVTDKFNLTKSASGYAAYTKANTTDMEYTKHSGMYCASDHRWAYTGNLGETECQAKCLELDCRCFDVSAAPGPAPHGLAARTIFPAFARGGASSDPLDAFGYHGVFPGLKKTTLGTYKESHQGGAPLCMYNHSDPNLPSVIFSPLNYPKAHHMASSADFVGAGVKNTATAIPAGHSQVPTLLLLLLYY